MLSPIKPEEVIKRKAKLIPDGVINSFNELISIKWNGSSSKFLQREVENLIKSKIRDRFFNPDWLNIKGIYTDAGWHVRYESRYLDDDPRDSYFEFTISEVRGKNENSI